MWAIHLYCAISQTAYEWLFHINLFQAEIPYSVQGHYVCDTIRYTIIVKLIVVIVLCWVYFGPGRAWEWGNKKVNYDVYVPVYIQKKSCMAMKIQTLELSVFETWYSLLVYRFLPPSWNNWDTQKQFTTIIRSCYIVYWWVFKVLKTVKYTHQYRSIVGWE